MKKVKTIILRTAGTNCDLETAYAFKKAGSEVDSVHINALIKRPASLLKYHIMAIPGGFTYGDDIASGKVLANELKNSLQKEISAFISRGRLLIGICNGFQVLVKMGILPDIGKKRDFSTQATLSLNDSGRFEDRWVYLKRGDRQGAGGERCVWTKGLPEVIYVPVAHAEGKFIPKDNAALKKLQDNGQIVFRYCSRDGGDPVYPENPNGSADNIAGVCDPTGRIMGMMPHPERHVTYLQHPNWRREGARAEGMGIGLKMFENGVNFARKEL